jgi:hypothetical protein
VLGTTVDGVVGAEDGKEVDVCGVEVVDSAKLASNFPRQGWHSHILI